jgi:hypothetical protein
MPGYFALNAAMALVQAVSEPAKDAMRAAVERRYGVRLAFQNCHRAAVFRPQAQDAYAAFTSARAQILNQRPELVDC